MSLPIWGETPETKDQVSESVGIPPFRLTGKLMPGRDVCPCCGGNGGQQAYGWCRLCNGEGSIPDAKQRNSPAVRLAEKYCAETGAVYAGLYYGCSIHGDGTLVYVMPGWYLLCPTCVAIKKNPTAPSQGPCPPEPQPEWNERDEAKT